jgi:hypothetical protein
MQVTYLIEPHKTAASLLEDKEYSIGLFANCMLKGTLQDQPTWIALCELGDFGPANDWNGQRSAAQRLYEEIVREIVAPACSIYRARVNELQNAC